MLPLEPGSWYVLGWHASVVLGALMHVSLAAGGIFGVSDPPDARFLEPPEIRPSFRNRITHVYEGGSGR
jgi:hypothetical protein